MFRPKKASPLAPRARNVAQPVSLPAPIGGLNVRDALAAMEPVYAVQMANFWPSGWGCFIRNGWQTHCVVPGTVDSLLNYARPDGAESLFAVSTDLNIYDVTASSLTPPVVYTVADPYVQSTNFTNVFGHFLICVNGVDTPFAFDDTAWATLTITGDLGDDQTTPTALDPTKFIDVIPHMRRLWFVEADSTRVWYLPVDAIQGAASLFDLGEIWPRGGYVMEIGSWTVDTGTGINDHLVIVSSEGDVAIFAGTDPDNDFTLIGVFTVAAPMSRRSITRRGGDLVIATTEGLLSMAGILQEQSEGAARTITDLIKPLLSAISNSAASLKDWQVQVYTKYDMLLYNTRDVWGSIVQYAMNTTTKAWTSFTGVPASCWGRLENEPFFGGVGVVGRFWYGSYDGALIDGTGGAFVEATAIQAYGYFNSSGQQKHFRMLRPNLRAASPPGVVVYPLVDFNGVNPLIAPDPSSVGYQFGIWDVTLWDESLWGQTSIPFLRWQQGGTIGTAGAVAIAMKCATPYCVWASTDIVIEAGGVL